MQTLGNRDTESQSEGAWALCWSLSTSGWQLEKKQYKKLGEETGTAFETPKPSNARVGGDSSPQANH